MAQVTPVDQSGISNRLVFEDSIEIPASITEVYNRWNNFPAFPQFMNNITEVRPLGGNRYHWVAKIFGIKQEWDADIIENDPQRRISWRSVSGAYNSGTVSFNNIAPDRTEVRLRLEYSPPGGKTGQALDQLTQVTKREVHEDLDNFRKLMAGNEMQQLNVQTQAGLGSTLAPLAIPLTAGIVGGVASYFAEQRLRANPAYNAITSPVALPNAIAGWIFTGACAASVIGSATLRSRGKGVDALFVGQWAPTFLGFGIFSRLLGHRGVRNNLSTSVMSWSYVAACLGSIATSATLHAQGKREQGLFVGQWAPTFLGLALFNRLFDRILSR